jgi:hypothetical protein
MGRRNDIAKICRTLPTIRQKTMVQFSPAAELTLQLSLTGLPTEMADEEWRRAKHLARSLAEQGGTGAAAVACVAEEIGIRRASLRHAERILAAMREQIRKNPGVDIRRYLAAQGDVAAESKRLMGALELLARMTRSSRPTLHFHGQNVVGVMGDSDE